MNKELIYLEGLLNNEAEDVRLNALRQLKKMEHDGIIEAPMTGLDVNNHIHTIYSFSPYSPAKAAWQSYKAGLCTAGIMDHDSIGGAVEFIEAGAILGIPTTIGMECRVDFSQTPIKGKRINNPDQLSNVYMALHGIPHTQIKKADDFFKPYREERVKRNIAMVDNINRLISQYGLTLDFYRDVYPLSKAGDGGTITERHILYGLSLLLVNTYGKGSTLVEFVKNRLGIVMTEKIEQYLLDETNQHYAYDLLGVLKSDLVQAFYIEATAECPDVREVINLSNEIGAITAYAYLGDVGNSVTGDKKSQKFEDDYLELLFEVLKELKFNAITYMPSRNTLEQIIRVKNLCEHHGFFQISGEDINSPRQLFICEALKQEEFSNLVEATWALIGHELSATQDIRQGLFSKESIERYPLLSQRIKIFAELGRKLC